MLCGITAFLISHFATDGSALALALLTAAAIILDFGVTTNLVVGQRAIYAIQPEHRSRLNGLFAGDFLRRRRARLGRRRLGVRDRRLDAGRLDRPLLP